MSLSVNFPSVAPSLNLDFAGSERLDPRITFTRATTARYYDGVTTAKAEENLLLQSQDFTTTWANNATTDTANTEVAPDGTTTADTVAETTDNNFHVVFQSVSASGTVTFSVFAKLGSGGTRFLTMGVNRDASNYAGATFDLSLGTVTQTVKTGAYTSESATITAAAQSYYRCTLTVTTDTVSQVRTGLCNTSTPGLVNRGSGAAYVGNTGETVILWGAQLEQRSAVTAYTPTTTQPITNYIPVLLTAAAGVARFDHTPTTGTSLGLLVEEQRTNLLTYSEDFANAAWTKTRASITANTIVAPDGTLTGDKLVEDTTATNTHQIIQTISQTKNATYTFSFYAKAAERTFCRVFLNGFSGNNIRASFNLVTGVVSATGFGGNGSFSNASAVSVGNGWFRCSLVGIPSASAGTGFDAQINLATDGTINGDSYTGNGFDGIFIWGAQVEAGAFPTSYIPTVAATVTRNADVATMTGTNFSSWYNATEGTVYFESQTTQGANSYPYSLFGADTFNRISSNYASTARITSSIRISSTFEAAETTPNNSAPVGFFGKGAVAYKVNDFGFSWNGAAALTDTSTTLPTVLKLDIGNNGALSGNFLNGTIRRIAYYPSRLTNEQLVALTR